jgi:hypothetical protein
VARKFGVKAAGGADGKVLSVKYLHLDGMSRALPLRNGLGNVEAASATSGLAPPIHRPRQQKHIGRIDESREIA